MKGREKQEEFKVSGSQIVDKAREVLAAVGELAGILTKCAIVVEKRK